MSKGIHRLKAEHFRKRKGPAKLCDGGGLWLFVKRSGSKSWVFRYRLNGQDYEMGLGSFNELSAAEARKYARNYRELKNQGINPIKAREQSRKQRLLEQAKDITFAQCAEQLIESKRPEWKNVKHIQQWTNTLTTYAFPVIGNLSVADVDTNLVLKVLEPIWTTKTETATRLRQRIESVLDWAAVREYRTGRNPALWRGHLDKILPQPSKIAKVLHQPALPYSEINTFVSQLRERSSLAARALEFLILTSMRTGEVRHALWNEIDMDLKVWTIPQEKMKSSRPHRVPLSDQALDLLKNLPSVGEFIFTGPRHGRPFSDAAMRQALKRMNYDSITVHGFRSTFRDWCAEQTNFPREVAEAALAHVLKDKTEAAYQRGDMLEKRRKLMQTWANYIDTKTYSSNVVNLRPANA